MRYLVCIDPAPAADGTCQQSAWVEQSSWRDLLPTVEQGNAIGFAFFSSLFLIAAAVRSFKPPRGM